MIELQVAHARIKSEMMQILTADQKAKLAADRGQARGAHEEAHERPCAAPSD